MHFLPRFCLLVFTLFVLDETGSVMSAAPPASLPQGTTRATLSVGPLQRTYLLHKPPGISNVQRIPLVIMLHGGAGSSGQLYEQRTGLSAKADAAHFIVAYPESAAGPDKRIWNGHMGTGDEDTKFIRALIELLKTTQPVDPSRVYLCGFSSGALMTERLGTELADQLAAIGIVSGSFFWETATSGADPQPPLPSRPISVMIIHGKADKNVPYDGVKNDRIIGWPVASAVEFWVRADGCNPSPQNGGSTNSNVVTLTYTGGKEGSEVVFHTLANWGHGWPLGGATGLNANDALWEFFSRHVRK